MTEYQIVNWDNHQGLQDKVNKMILEGWEPVGSMKIGMPVQTGSGIDQRTYQDFYQTMIRYD